MSEIRVAIAGVGNCALAFAQGLTGATLSRPEIGGYRVNDIKIVAAFDVTEPKVGMPFSEAVRAWPNETWRSKERDVLVDEVIVQRGPLLDGFGKYLREKLKVAYGAICNVPKVLQEAKVDVLINWLPVGSQRATEFYVSAALEAKCAFVNCIPVFIAGNPAWAANFAKRGLPIIGDDIKSQLGATIVHRVLAQLFRDRGVKLERTMQLNVGGNADFLNMLERERLQSKKISKTQAVQAVVGPRLDDVNIHVGPSDYVEWLGDRKLAIMKLEGTGFGGAPVNLEVKLEVWDSPNAAEMVIDAVRCAKLAMDCGIGGVLGVPSAWLMKSPPVQMDDDKAFNAYENWIFEQVNEALAQYAAKRVV